jgi:hypothetical protein
MIWKACVRRSYFHNYSKLQVESIALILPGRAIAFLKDEDEKTGCSLFMDSAELSISATMFSPTSTGIIKLQRWKKPSD